MVSDSLVGMRLGEYEVLERIGEGGMGVVYRGVQPVIKKRVAIKVLKRDAASDQAAVQRLVFEAEAVNSIRHRGIIDIFSLGRLPDGRPYIVMEFLEGEPLDVYLASHPVPLSDALALLAGICRPLGAAHRAGVVHRDLKPSNVFICESDGERYLKLLDFGIAKKAGGDSEVSQVHRVLGTPNYMAPEQARAEPVSPRTDVYALGVIAFEMLTGHLPFRGEQVMDVITGHLASPVPSLVELNPSIPDGLDALVRRMLAKSPDERPQSTEEVQQELLSHASSSAVSSLQHGLRLRQSSGELGSVPGRLTIDATLLRPGAGGVVVAVEPKPKPRQHRLALGLGALVLVLAVAVGLTFRGGEGSTQHESSGADVQAGGDTRQPDTRQGASGVQAGGDTRQGASGVQGDTRQGASDVQAGGDARQGASGVQSGGDTRQGASGVQAGGDTRQGSSGVQGGGDTRQSDPRQGASGAQAGGDIARDRDQRTDAGGLAGSTSVPGSRDAGSIRDARARSTRGLDGGAPGRPGRDVTEELLLTRLTRLEATLKQAAGDGDEPNPAALALLQKYRLQATTRLTPAEREALWKTLDDFERTFLR